VLNCPECNAPTKVKYSWFTKLRERRRRYYCENGHKFTSEEKVVRSSKGKPPVFGQSAVL
jgi:transcriptional regulator NrdR family protein